MSAAVAVPEPDFVLRGHDSAVNCVSFLQDGRGLLSGGLDGELRLWSLESRRAVVRSAAHSESILSVAALPSDGSCSGSSSNLCMSSARDECLKVWDVERLSTPSGAGASEATAPLLVLPTGARHFCNSAVGADGLLVTPSAGEHRALLWDVRVGSVVLTVQTEESRGTITALQLPSALSTSRGGPVLLTGLEDGSLAAFDLRTVRPLPTTAGGAEPLLQVSPGASSVRDVHEREPLMAMDVTPDGCSVLTGGADTNLARIECASPSATASVDGGDGCEGFLGTGGGAGRILADLPQPGTSGICVRADGRIAVSGHWDGTARIFDVGKPGRLRPLAVLPYHRESVFSVAFDPTSASGMGSGQVGRFATGSKDCTIALWSVYASSYKAKVKAEAHGNGNGKDRSSK